MVTDVVSVDSEDDAESDSETLPCSVEVSAAETVVCVYRNSLALIMQP